MGCTREGVAGVWRSYAPSAASRGRPWVLRAEGYPHAPLPQPTQAAGLSFRMTLWHPYVVIHDLRVTP
jgi:hypothetical protein